MVGDDVYSKPYLCLCFKEENEERSALEMSEKKKLEPLIKILINWINNELAEKRVIVKDLMEDMYDGQILQMLIGKTIDIF